MKTRLTNGLSEELAGLVEREFNQSPRLRERVVEVIEKDINALHKSMRANDFNEANWANIHAHKLGEAHALAKVVALLS